MSVHTQEALMAKAWSLSKIRARLATKTSQQANLERGLPQGAVESPIIFAKVLECVCRRCEERWTKKGWGFWIDGKRWVRTSHADDKRDLEAMIRDITTELEAVGLDLDLEKPCTSTERIQWEQVLVFMGMALDLSGSD